MAVGRHNRNLQVFKRLVLMMDKLKFKFERLRTDMKKNLPWRNKKALE